MIKWTRVKLVLSILTAAGLWQTLAERISFAASSQPGGGDEETERPRAVPTQYELSGVLHIHSTYSDGAGTIEDIAEAGAEAGVDFVLVTDHSSLEAIHNGEQRWYHEGKVLMMIGTEISTDTGHLLVLDVPPAMDVEPGSAVEIMDKVVEAGGYGYIALPLDLKDHWRDFSRRHEQFGLEVFNLSSIARTKISIPGLLLALRRYYGKRPISAFSYVAARPERELKLWDRLSAEAFQAGRLIPSAIGCLDAHAILKFGGKQFPIPSYVEVFRTLRTHVLVSEPPSRAVEGAQRDIALIHEGLRSGHSFLSYDNYGDSRGFSFQLRTDKESVAGMGDRYQIDERWRVFLEVRSPNRRSIIRLFRNGRAVAVSRGHRLTFPVQSPGVYRVEVSNYRRRIGPFCLAVHPWIFSNQITISGDTKR